MKKAFLNILGFIFMVFAVSGLMVTVLYVFVNFWERDSKGYSQHNNTQNINNQNINNQINLALDYAYGENFDDRKAIELFNAAAAQGSLDAKMKLADYYLNTERDDLAVSAYKELVSKNYMPAKCELGMCYMKGVGVYQDEKLGREYIEEAHLSGCADGTYYLGLCYFDGLGVEKDLNKAVALFEEASDQGVAGAKMYLGACYLGGIGVEKSLITGMALIEEAARMGEPRAIELLEQMKHKSIR